MGNMDEGGTKRTENRASQRRCQERHQPRRGGHKRCGHARRQRGGRYYRAVRYLRADDDEAVQQVDRHAVRGHHVGPAHLRYGGTTPLRCRVDVQGRAAVR
jgi:hypothetical protein